MSLDELTAIELVRVLGSGGPMAVLVFISWQLRGLCDHMQLWEPRVHVIHHNASEDEESP